MKSASGVPRALLQNEAYQELDQDARDLSDLLREGKAVRAADMTTRRGHSEEHDSLRLARADLIEKYLISWNLFNDEKGTFIKIPVDMVIECIKRLQKACKDTKVKTEEGADIIQPRVISILDA